MISLVELQKKLNEIVVGQEEAVNTLSAAMYKYLLKMYARDYGIYFDSSTTILLLGNTGVGKTYLARQLAEIFNISYIEINSKSLSQDGSWAGASFSDLVADQHLGNRRGAIIFIDEFDKILTANISSGGDDVNYHVQCSLLKYIEGFEIRHKGCNLHTKNCFFILAGAFVGLELKSEKQIGFNQQTTSTPELHDALIKFGMVPELAGRIQNITQLVDLNEKDYFKLLNSEHFIYNKYRQILKKLGIAESMFRKKLVNVAIKKNLGVRGLIQEVEKYISDVILENKDYFDLNKLNGIESPDAKKQ